MDESKGRNVNGKKIDKIDMAKEDAWETTISKQDGVIGIILIFLPEITKNHEKYIKWDTGH